MTHARHPVTVEVVLLNEDRDCPTGIGYRIRRHGLPSSLPPDLVAHAVAARVPGAADSIITGTDPESAQGSGWSRVQVLHSTSWRWDDDLGIVLTYAAILDERGENDADSTYGFAKDDPATRLVTPSVVCSGDAARPTPDELHEHHVVAHAVRHLAYLADRDPGIVQAASTSTSPNLWVAFARAAAHMPTAPHAQAHERARRSHPDDNPLAHSRPADDTFVA